MRRNAGNKQPSCPHNMRRRSAARPSGSSTGAEDNIVAPRQDELLYAALKAAGGRVRLWIYQGLRHDCWTRAFNEPELPRWLLVHRRETREQTNAFAERIVIPLHPPALKLSAAQLDSFGGDYVDRRGLVVVTLFRQGDVLYQKNHYGEIAELAAESSSATFSSIRTAAASPG